MTKADNSTRRTFLASAALAVAGSAALPALAVASREPDPIFAAIEVHKAAVATTRAAIDRHSELDRELPIEKCRSRITAWEEEIVSTDDPRWIECERALLVAFDAENEAACGLVNINPVTFAGVVALLSYAHSADTDGEGWPSDLETNDGGKPRARSWHFFLIQNLAETLPSMVQA